MLLCLSLPFNASAQPKTTIKWTTKVWSKVAEENGTGAYFDLLNAVYPSSDYELEHRFLPYQRGVLYLQEGSMDILSICHEIDGVDPAKYPWAQESLGVIYSKKSNKKWIDNNSLINANITTNKEMSILPFIKHLNSNFIKTNNRERSLQLLLLNRADYFLGIYTNIVETVNNNDTVSMDNFHFQTLHTVTCYPGFSPSKKGQNLKKTWEAGVERLHKTGQLKSIFDKWKLEYPNYQWKPKISP